jgi:hypothetical protein
MRRSFTLLGGALLLAAVAGSSCGGDDNPASAGGRTGTFPPLPDGTWEIEVDATNQSSDARCVFLAALLSRTETIEVRNGRPVGGMPLPEGCAVTSNGSNFTVDCDIADPQSDDCTLHYLVGGSGGVGASTFAANLVLTTRADGNCAALNLPLCTLSIRFTGERVGP